jgi:hypothetical protein
MLIILFLPAGVKGLAIMPDIMVAGQRRGPGGMRRMISKFAAHVNFSLARRVEIF